MPTYATAPLAPDGGILHIINGASADNTARLYLVRVGANDTDEHPWWTYTAFHAQREVARGIVAGTTLSEALTAALADVAATLDPGEVTQSIAALADAALPALTPVA